MPSIPQSLLWISLVVLWLFVLVPMLISKRDTVRRTSDVALATRVLNTSRGARLLRRTGPAAGHHSDPHWRPTVDDHEHFKADDEFESDEDVPDVEAEPLTAPNQVVVLAAAVAPTESKYLDVDVVEEDSGALPIGVSGRARAEHDPQLPLDFDASTQTFSVDDLTEVDDAEDELDEVVLDEDADEDLVNEADPVTDSFAASEDDDYDYEYVDDSSGVETASDADLHVAGSASPRRDRFETKTAAAVSARKYKFRKRMLTVMAALLFASSVTAYLVTPTLWWVCGTIGAVTVLYLGYLRRQTRIEAKVRRRRAQRMARSRLGVENTRDREFDVVPSRLRRPGSVVLEIDDEDPVFEHLDYVPFARDYALPHASGQ